MSWLSSSIKKTKKNISQLSISSVGDSISSDFYKNPIGYISGASMNPAQSISNALGIDKGLTDPFNIQKTGGDIHDPAWMALKESPKKGEAPEPTSVTPGSPDLLFRRRSSRANSGFRSLMIPLLGKAKTQSGLGIPM